MKHGKADEGYQLMLTIEVTVFYMIIPNLSYFILHYNINLPWGRKFYL
jgi:hypothetical protein